MSRKNFLLLILIIVSCVFGITFANYINTLTNDGEVTITINYISEENSVFATLTSLQVDTEIGNGRVWISNLDDVKIANSNFIAPENKEFIGWQYKSSIISGVEVTSTSAYTVGDHFTQDEYYSLSENEQK